MTKTLRTVRKEKDLHVTAPALSTAVPTSNSVHGSLQAASHVAASSTNRADAASEEPAAVDHTTKVILVAYYRE